MSVFGVILVRVSRRIQFECWKMWTRITPNTDTFYAVCTVIVYNSWYYIHMTKEIACLMYSKILANNWQCVHFLQQDGILKVERCILLGHLKNHPKVS